MLVRGVGEGLGLAAGGAGCLGGDETGDLRDDECLHALPNQSRGPA